METKSANGSLPMPAETPVRNALTKHREEISMSYLIGYLGREILTNDETSKGCLQRRVIELFLLYLLNAYHSRLQQESHLSITSRAITIYTNGKIEKNVLQKDISSVQLLQTVYETRGEFLYFAFEPVLELGKNQLICDFLFKE